MPSTQAGLRLQGAPPIVQLVEFPVFLTGDVVNIPRPDWLGLVQLFLLSELLLNSLLLGPLFTISVTVISNILNFRLSFFLILLPYILLLIIMVKKFN